MQQKPIFLYIVFLAAGLLVGFGLGRVSAPAPAPAPAPPKEESVPVSALPLAPDILTNPVFYEWWASADGTLVAKTDNSFTLESNGVELVVSVIKTEEGGSLSTFWKPKEPGSFELMQISLAEIPLGTKLLGKVSLATKDTTGLGTKPGEVVGSSFHFAPEE